MDYLSIIMEGWTDEAASSYLTEYFVRQYKTYESRQHFTTKEFFTGLILAWVKLNNEFNRQLDEQTNDNPAERDKKIKDNFTVDVSTLTGYEVQMTYFDIQYLKTFIVEARKQVISDTPRRNKPQFKHYFTTDNPGSVIEALKSHYAGSKPKEFALMAVALKKLEIIHSDIAVNKTKLYKALSQEFGNIGSRQNFSDKLDKYLNSSYSFDKNEIQEHIEKLQSILPLQ